jgi:hypothetical protein
MENDKLAAEGKPEAELPAINSDSVMSVAGKLLANPELIASVASALGLGTPPAEKKESEEIPSPERAEAQPSDTPSAAIQKDKLPELISNISPLLSALGTARSSDSKRACLLRALKPYLSSERCEAIDYMIKLSEISEAFKTISKEATNV